MPRLEHLPVADRASDVVADHRLLEVTDPLCQRQQHEVVEFMRLVQHERPDCGSAQPGQVRSPTEPATQVGITGGTETILLVEDDEAVRRYAAAALGSFGYRVLEAADGPSALAQIQQRDDIDLLFTNNQTKNGDRFFCTF